MIPVIAAKEILEIRRDGRFRIAAIVFWLLSMSAFAAGVAHYAALTREAQTASQDERARWLDQGRKYPHAAAHYGVFAFKSPRPLTVFDSGIEPYLGSSIWLEAHKQNESLYRPAEDATSLQRFGDLTLARLAQELVPLLIIILGYAAFAGERETGTLRQLMSLGVPGHKLLLGKAAGLASGIAVLCLPAALLVLVSSTVLSEPLEAADELLRAVLLILAYGAYLGGFIFLTLAVSAWCRSARATLVILLAFWTLSVLAVPRFLAGEAGAISPTGLAIDRRTALETALKEAGARLEEKTKTELLEKYRAASIEELPVDYWGVALQADEEGKYEIFEKHYAQLFDALARESALYQLGTLLSPLTGLQIVSMTLAGSDTSQHRDFVRQAEAYRRVIHTVINDYILKNAVRDAEGKWKVEAGRELWETIPPFQYGRPGAARVLPHCGLGLALLGLWLALCFAAAWRAAGRITPL